MPTENTILNNKMLYVLIHLVIDDFVFALLSGDASKY